MRDRAGDPVAFEEALLAVEVAGATPLADLASNRYLRRLLSMVDVSALGRWHEHRARLMREVDRLLVLGGDPLDTTDIPDDALRAWEQSVARINAAEELKRTPFLLVGVPTDERARRCGITRQELESIVLPALAAPVAELQAEIDHMRGLVGDARRIVIRSDPEHALELDRGDRIWLEDDGCVDEHDRARGAGVSNLPGGSIYTTVLEERTTGSVMIPRAGDARDVVLHFTDGVVVDIDAATGRERFVAMLDRHTGDARRISHIGIGLNPRLRRPVGWELIDEHVHGYVFLALGENRYMGGRNASSLNIDFTVPTPTVMADGRVVVESGRIRSRG